MLGFDLVGLIVLLLIVGIIYYLVTLLPLPEPFPTLIKVVVVVAAIIWLAQRFL